MQCDLDPPALLFDCSNLFPFCSARSYINDTLESVGPRLSLGNFLRDADYFIIKYDPAGNVLWIKRIDLGGWEEASDVAIDSKESIIVTGSSRVGRDSNWYIIKLDSNGNILWIRNYDGGLPKTAAYFVATA